MKDFNYKLFHNYDFFKWLFVLFITAFLSSCSYSPYINLDYKIFWGDKANNNQTAFAFLATKKAYYRPKGIATFPDGGTAKYVFSNVSLYLFTKNDTVIKKIADLNDLASIIGNNETDWRIRIALTDSFLFYKITPVISEDLIIKEQYSQTQKQNALQVLKKYKQARKINIVTGKIQIVDSVSFNKALEESVKPDISFRKIIYNLPAKKLGFNIKKIVPAEDDIYMDQIIYLKGNEFTRKAIMEQIIPKLTNEQIEKMLQKIEGHKNELEQGYYRTSYEEEIAQIKKELQKGTSKN